MSDLARTYLRQARSFVRAGDIARASELLERARALSGGDKQLEIEVFDESAKVFEALGDTARASQYRDYVRQQSPSQPPPAPALAFQVLPSGPNRTRLWLIVAAAAMILVAAVGTTVLVMRGAQRATAPASPAAVAAPALQETPSSLDDNGAPPPGPQPAPASGMEQALRDNVGLVLTVFRYEGTSDDKPVWIDCIQSTGTAFAVDKNGLMMTNSHVVGAETADAPVIQLPGQSPLRVRERYFLVCFGANPAQHHRAEVVHHSSTYDFAVLRIQRKFAKPLALAEAPMHQGDSIYACGYPGIVGMFLTATSLTPARQAELVARWRETSHYSEVELVSPDCFNSTLTKGIVSAPERNIEEVAYLQMDAVVAPGNSGGPVLNERQEVVGITTLGLEAATGGRYNFALLVGQLKEELDQCRQQP